MILPREPVIFVATAPVDLRWGFDKLAAVVVEAFGKSPRDGALFVFRNKARNRLKVLFFDRTGAWLLHRRLDRGTFPIPTSLEADASHVRVSPRELELLVAGLEQSGARRVRRKPVVH